MKDADQAVSACVVHAAMLPVRRGCFLVPLCGWCMDSSWSGMGCPYPPPPGVSNLILQQATRLFATVCNQCSSHDSRRRTQAALKVQWLQVTAVNQTQTTPGERK
jgi:hypothetical protein